MQVDAKPFVMFVHSLVHYRPIRRTARNSMESSVQMDQLNSTLGQHRMFFFPFQQIYLV
jgi:hypothetical protein